MTLAAAERLTHAASIVEGLAQQVEQLTLTRELDAVVAAGVVPVSGLPTEEFIAVAEEGATVRLTLEAGSGDEIRLQLVDSRCEGSTEGDFEAVVPGVSDPLDQRDLLADFRQILLHAPDYVLCHVSVTVQNQRPDEFRWLPDEQTLDQLIADLGWLEVARELEREGGPARIVAGGGGSFETLRFLVHDPSIWPPIPAHGNVSAERQLGQGAALNPQSFVPTRGEGLALVRRLFSTMGETCAWLELAETVSQDPLAVQLYRGGPFLELPANADAGLLELHDWAAQWNDALHQESLRQAFSSFKARDSFPETKGVLETAKFLANRAQQGLVAEVVEERRRSREAASATALKAAADARAAVRSLVDRVVLTLAAAGGVLVAQKLQFGSRLVAGTLLLILALIVLAAAIVSYHVEFPAAVRPLDALGADLSAIFEGLTASDVEVVVAMSSVGAARAGIRGARQVVRRLLVGGALTLSAVFLVAMTAGLSRHVDTPSTPSTPTAPSTRSSAATSTSTRPAASTTTSIPTTQPASARPRSTP